MDISLVKLCAVIVASLMAGATFGFLFCAILANGKYRDMQAENVFDGTKGNGYQPLKCAGEGNARPPGSI